MRRITISLIVAAIVLAACGGSSSKNSGASGGDTTTTPSGGKNDFANLAANFAKARIKITYTSGSGTDASTFTLAQDGNGKSAYTSGNSTIYNDGKTTVSCDGTGATATCTDIGSLGGAAAGLGGSLAATFSTIAASLTTLDAGDKSSEIIAGRDASCVTYKASDLVGRLGTLPFFKGTDEKSSDYDPNDSAKICIDKNTGFVLQISATKKGQSQDELLATDVGEPSDSDFTPPVTPETVPKITLPGGGTLPTIPSG